MLNVKTVNYDLVDCDHRFNKINIVLNGLHDLRWAPLSKYPINRYHFSIEFLLKHFCMLNVNWNHKMILFTHKILKWFSFHDSQVFSSVFHLQAIQNYFSFYKLCDFIKNCLLNVFLPEKLLSFMNFWIIFYLSWREFMQNQYFSLLKFKCIKIGWAYNCTLLLTWEQGKIRINLKRSRIY